MEIPENRRWMYNRINPKTKWVTVEFERGAGEFLDHARGSIHSQTMGKLRCPCVKCKCVPYRPFDEVKTHLYSKGFMPKYYVWTSHGESITECHSVVSQIPGVLHASPGALGNQLSQYETKVIDAVGLSLWDNYSERIEEVPNATAKAFHHSHASPHFISEDYMRRKEPVSAEVDSPSVQSDQEELNMWLDVTRGKNKKGRTYVFAFENENIVDGSPSINNTTGVNNNNIEEELRNKIIELSQENENLKRKIQQKTQHLEQENENLTQKIQQKIEHLEQENENLKQNFSMIVSALHGLGINLPGFINTNASNQN